MRVQRLGRFREGVPLDLLELLHGQHAEVGGLHVDRCRGRGGDDGGPGKQQLDRVGGGLDAQIGSQIGLADAKSAFYFSGVTYTTIGYGDLVLQEPWRMLGPVEGLTGILMCGLSAGIFFAVVSRIYLSRSDVEPK